MAARRQAQRACLRRAALCFGELRMEDWARLPVKAVVGLLGADGLAVKSEDEVHAAVRAYVDGREDRGERLTGEERRSLWSCCRLAFCSASVQVRQGVRWKPTAPIAQHTLVITHT